MSGGSAASPTPTAQEEAPEPSATRRDWLALGTLLLGTLVVQVDFFSVNIALPSIQRELGATLAEVQLIAITYSGAFAVLVITGGRLGDLFGRKRMFVVGLVSFGVASLLCGIAWTGWVLVGARVLQGWTAALVMPQAIGSIHAMFSGPSRDRAFAVFGVSMGLAWVGGIVLGGLLVSADLGGLGWRMIFLINLPLAAIATVGAAKWLDESKRPDDTTLDVPGMVTLGVLVGLVVVPLIQGRQAGWPAWVHVCLALAVAVAALHVLVERRVAARGVAPVVPPDLFRDRNFRLGLTVIVVFFLGPPGFFLLTTLYLQAVIGFSALQAAMSLLAFGVAFVLSSEPTKRLKARMGERVIVLGVGVMVVGVAAFGLALEQAGTGLTVARMAPGLALLGAGQALVTIPLYEMLLRHVPKEVSATAGGVFTTVQIVAQALSVAVVVIVFAAIVERQADSVVHGDAERLHDALLSQEAAAGTADDVVGDYRACVGEAAANLAAGTAVSCEAHPAWQEEVDDAAADSVAVIAQRGFVRTLGFNVVVLVASGLIIARSARREKA